jgi:hypothetical protein
MSNILPATYPKQHQYPTPTTRQSTETMVDRAGAILTITMPVIDGDITIAGGWYYVLQCTIVTTFALFVVDHLLMVAWMGYTKVSRCVCVCVCVSMYDGVCGLSPLLRCRGACVVCVYVRMRAVCVRAVPNMYVLMCSPPYFSPPRTPPPPPHPPTHKARWFTLHSIANLVITVLCIPDLIFLLSDPMAALVQKRSDNLPISIIMALHIYHIAIFPKLHWTDVLHHALMIPGVCRVCRVLRGTACSSKYYPTSFLHARPLLLPAMCFQIVGL